MDSSGDSMDSSGTLWIHQGLYGFIRVSMDLTMDSLGDSMDSSGDYGFIRDSMDSSSMGTL